MNPEFGLDQGFDEYYHYSAWPGGFEELEVEVGRALDKLNRVPGRPFFMFFHTYEIHDPFHERSPYSDRCYEGPADDPTRDLIFGALPRPRSEAEHLQLMFDLVKWPKGEPIDSAVRVERDQIDLVNCLYDSAITYADAQVDGILNHLDRRGILDDTLVVITSDHGESLGEKGLYKHAYLYENNLMVPLIFLFPRNLHGGTVVDQQVATVDIVPTILDTLGIEAPAGIDGETLLPLLENDDAHRHRPEAWSYAAYENRGVSIRIDDQTKFIFNNTAPSDAHGVEELFELISDPGEVHNLAGADPETSARLRDRLFTYVASKTAGSPLTIDNIDCDRVDGTLAGESLTTRLKALELEADSLERLSDSQVEFTIARGRQMHLFFEATDIVDIELRATGCRGDDKGLSTLRREVVFGQPDGPLFLGLRGDGWLDSDDPDFGSDGVLSLLVRIGGRSEDAESIAGVVQDEAVLEQLKSLGYLE